MPTYFQVVKQVLDQLYGELALKDRDDKVKGALNALSQQYRNVLEDGGPNYSDDYTKFAYIYRYTTAHANFLSKIISQSPTIQSLLKGDRLVVSCVGGGPGSDVLGFVKYLLTADPKPHVTYFLLDKDQSWGDAWWNLDEIVGSDLRTSSNFVALDVTEKESWRKSKAYLKADIFTLVYFLSEIYLEKDSADKFLRSTFDAMKSGSALIVLDFNDDKLSEWIDSIAKDCGLSRKGGKDDEEWVIDPDEEKKDLGKYYEKFDTPRLRGRLFFRVYKKN
jgi:hypothetical protein